MNIYRDNYEYFISFKDGNAIKQLKKVGKTKKQGTKITFLPSKNVFSSIKFSSNVLQKRMRELAFLNKGINIVLIDDTGSKKKEYPNKYDGGVSEFVRFINKKKPIFVGKNEKEVFKKPILIYVKNDVVVDCSFEWNAGYSRRFWLLQIILIKDGGTHLLGSALTRL